MPSLALIAFFVAYLGMGFANLTLALVLLAMPPILTNTYVAVTQVDPDTVDSARGMGMTEPEIVRKVELPLALPLIFGGVQISMVNVVATATIAPLAGINTLGDPIINVSDLWRHGSPGSRDSGGRTRRLHGVVPRRRSARRDPRGAEARNRHGVTAAPTISVSDQEGSTHMRSKRWLHSLFALLLLTRLVRHRRLRRRRRRGRERGRGHVHGEARRDPERTRTTRSVKLTIGSKNFTEQKVLGEIYAQGLAAAGYTVKKQLNLGDEKTALKALEGGRDRRLPRVHGHGAAVVLRRAVERDPEGPAGGLTSRPRSTSRRRSITACLPRRSPAPTRSRLTKEKADELGVTKISDLKGK